MSEPIEDQIAEIKQHFEFFDADQNGAIDFAEFRELMRAIAPRTSTQQAAEGFSMIDTNSDGHIDLDEFVAWWRTNWTEF